MGGDTTGVSDRTRNSAGRLAHYQRGGKVTDYTYNAQGQRTMKRTRLQADAAASGQDTVLYHYDRLGRLIMESDATGRLLVDYIWMDNRPVLQTVYDRNTAAEVTRTYLLTDHSGTPRVGLNDQQQIVWRWDDGGFGEEKADEHPDGDGHKVTINLRFPGQYYDKESGLHYNYFRYYDPKTGRYIASDPIGLLGSINTYAYVDNNPLKYIDPYGLSKFDKFFGLPKQFWNWFHRHPDMKDLKGPDGQVPKDIAENYYKEWKDLSKPKPDSKGKQRGSADPDLLEWLIPWPLIPSELGCGELDCNYSSVPDYEEKNQCK